ncbi:diacylglycerol O-acyltransferase isoform X2 [Arctopsyche grandis]|uniref:diacylglycerol O-acyltransferase isoform X2 n=1 Tax=Arctopsyche grandis TaxID=121162 RepID=UPI00406D92D7
MGHVEQPHQQVPSGGDPDEKTLRFRRAQSVTRAEEITEKEQKARKSQHDKPCHKPQDSLFSWSSGFDNFTGFVNWGFLLLSMGGIRLFLENLIKYGIMVDPLQWFVVLTGQNIEGREHPSIVLLVYCCVPIVICLLIEKAISVGIFSHKLGSWIHIINIFFLVSLPVIVIHLKADQFSLIGGMSVSMLYLVVFLKLWSYIQVNFWCREAIKKASAKSTLRRQSLSAPHWKSLEDEKNGTQEEIDQSIVKYPDNLNIKDIFYFILAPTLCYELNFPRTTRIRKRFLVKRILEVFLGIHLIMALFQQWMIPSVQNSLIPFTKMDYMHLTERLLKLAIPNHLIWLCFFYLMFHSFLNLMGELLHFADRNFYNDWWNANNIDTFWRTWNMPVHRWAVRHVYIPVVRRGHSKSVAGIIVFFISAFFHEYLVSVPIQTYRIWAFTGMMAQVPLSYVSRYVEKHYGARWGNIIVWSSIILGQPLAIMMYYHDYVISHFT